MKLARFDSDRRRFNRELISRYPMVWSLRLHYVALALWPLLTFIDVYYVATSWEKHETLPAIQQWCYFSALVALGFLLVWLRIQLRATQQRPHLVGPFGGCRFFLGALFVSWSLAWVPFQLSGAMRAHLAASISLPEVCVDRERIHSICEPCMQWSHSQCISTHYDITRCSDVIGPPPKLARPSGDGGEAYRLALETVRGYGFVVEPTFPDFPRTSQDELGITPSQLCLTITRNPDFAEALRETHARASQAAVYADPRIFLHPPQFLTLVFIISTNTAALATLAQTTSTKALLHLLAAVFGIWLAVWLMLSIVFELELGSPRSEVADGALQVCVAIAACVLLVALPLKKWSLSRGSLLFILFSLPQTPTGLVWNWINTSLPPETPFTMTIGNTSFFATDGTYWFCCTSAALLGLGFAAYRPISQRAEAQPSSNA